MIKKVLFGLKIFTITLCVSGPILADDYHYDNFLDFVEKTQIDGDIRSFYFTRDYSNPNVLDQAAYSLGGNIRILTAPNFTGLQIGAAYYTAQSLGLNNSNPAKVDATLPGKDIGVLGQAYIQYQRAPLFIRVGDQLINTPWLAAGDSRMIPATYRGVYGVWTPQKNWTITALRTFEFKSRIADNFSKTNLYNENNLGSPIPKLGDDTDQGAWALGANFNLDTLNSQTWAYQFLDFGKLFFNDTQYVFNTDPNLRPLIGAQLFTESGDGDNILQQVSSGKADANGYGLLAGLIFYNAKLTAGFNQIFSAAGAFKNGDIVSPYTTGYADDPLYSTSMIAGLVEKSSGDAYKVTASYAALEKALLLSVSFAQYFTQPEVHDTAETDFDMSYSFAHSQYKYLKDLSIRNRLGIQTGDPAKGTFYYNRVMLQYSF